MEQYSQYLKSSKSILASPFSSWEERAFAEDARGPLGSFVWPPRSYCCSFCRREFKSAQALGGHMNVHRREKAKIKQSVDKESVCKESLEHGFFVCNRVSSMPTLGQESLDSSSSTKSCVYDEGFVAARGVEEVETDLVLGFDVNSCSNSGGVKRRKTTDVTPVPIMGGLDLELRLAS